MLGRFFRFALPRFSGAPSEDDYEFLIFWKDRLHNLCIIKTREVDCTHFLLDLVA